MDISETTAEYAITTEIPEVKKEDVKVTLEHGVLTVQGTRRREAEEKGTKYHRVERSYGSFARSFSLPDSVVNYEGVKIRGNLNNGAEGVVGNSFSISEWPPLENELGELSTQCPRRRCGPIQMRASLQ